ncbi:SGNH_hydrolase domain containing protein [uncultured Caudovirales phage]|uniref:SGNH_hydrolase domain containing protein n=1 Tax=uncultured Caudovirales phage TaxID=2100421 RepID=A0A6J5TA02_9CAUD|nr:SGNH_hydrolase domain containing protein [uncultured Caudovirales phage]
MKRILVLGDSITYGHGCADRMYYWDTKSQRYVGDNTTFVSPSSYCWAQHLENKFGYSVTNLAKSGDNNSNMASNCLEAVYKNNQKFDYIIASFTYDDRLEWAHPDYDYLVSASPLAPPQFLQHQSKSWATAMKAYRDTLYHPGWGVKLTHLAINTVANVSKEIGAQFFWSVPEFNQTKSSEMISPALRLRQLPSVIGHCNLWQNGSMLSSADSPYCAVDGHPNELAHLDYFQKVITPLFPSTN